MLRPVTVLASLLVSGMLFAAGPEMKYVEASTLTLTGKLFPDTPNPYHRLDTVRFKGFTPMENGQVRESSGIAVAFRTDSRTVTLKVEYGHLSYPNNTNGISARGFDLYIKERGRWRWASNCCPKSGFRGRNVEMTLAKGLDGSMKECLLYLPLYSEEKSVRIGIEDGCVIEALDNPFSHRVAVFGSSYTHGSSTSRAGMPWPAQFSRATGIQMLSLGCSGNSKLQPYFAKALSEADVDAYVFDAFSNPPAEMIEERLFRFIDIIRSVKPDTPMIFLKTAYREGRHFDSDAESKESAKMSVADSLMRIACKRYENVYWVTSTDTRGLHYEATVDGTHPDNYGYWLWEKSVEKPLKRILYKHLGR